MNHITGTAADPRGRVVSRSGYHLVQCQGVPAAGPGFPHLLDTLLRAHTQETLRYQIRALRLEIRGQPTVSRLTGNRYHIIICCQCLTISSDYPLSVCCFDCD